MILETTKEKKHVHALYIQQDGSVFVSEKNGHIHPYDIIIQEGIQFNPEMLKDVNFLMQSIVLGEVDGHSHFPKPLSIVETEDKSITQSDEDKVTMVYELNKTADGCEESAISKADYCHKFLHGDQWDDVDKNKLKKEKRACLTINETKPKIDAMIGYQIKNRTDVDFFPRELGDGMAADIMNYAFKNVWDNSKADAEESKVFTNQISLGKGMFHVYVDTTDNMRGDIKIESRDRDEVVFSEHNKPDGSDAENCTFRQKISFNKLKANYPDKADEIETDMAIRDFAERYFTDNGLYPSSFDCSSDDRYPEGGTISLGSSYNFGDSDWVDASSKTYKILEQERKIWKTRVVFYDSEKEFFYDITGSSKDIQNQLKQVENSELIYNGYYKIRKTAVAGNIVLYDDWSLFSRFSFVPAYCDKLKNFWYGKVYQILDIQREVNKRHSQTTDIINRCAAYGVGYDPDAFEDEKDEKAFKRNKAVPGFIQKFKEGFKDKIHIFEGVKFPSEILGAADVSSAKLGKIMNINEELVGAVGNAESGVAMNLMQKAALLGNEYIFDNLSYSKLAVVKLVVEAIQLIKTPDDILRLVENQNKNSTSYQKNNSLYPPVQLPEEAVAVVRQSVESGKMNQDQANLYIKNELAKLQEQSDLAKRAEIMEVLKNKNLLKYDLKIVERPENETRMAAQYMSLATMAQQGVPIPPTSIVELSPLLTQKQKNEINQSIIAQQNAQAQQEQAKVQSEITKTLIANENKTGQPSGVS